MIFFWFALFIALGVYSYTIWGLSKKRVGSYFQLRKEWVSKNFKLIVIGALLVTTLIVAILNKPLRRTVWCAYKGHEHSVDTRYNWISGVCSYKGKNDTWIPISRLLDIPEGDDGQPVMSNP